ncbi:hypothetical protein EB001_05060 [bacterium]|nr:hypothetical protein [bacterium]
MTHYDKLIDIILDKLYTWYVAGQIDSQFDAEMAKKSAHEILTIVEEFQANRNKLTQWRATD